MRARKGAETFHNAVYNNYRRDAFTKRRIEFKLSKDLFVQLIHLPCSYCGDLETNTWVNKDTKEVWKYTGIDRLDSSKPYQDDNVCSCCKDCNYAKRKLSVEEFLAKIKKIYDYNGLGKSETFVELTKEMKENI